MFVKCARPANGPGTMKPKRSVYLIADGVLERDLLSSALGGIARLRWIDGTDRLPPPNAAAAPLILPVPVAGAARDRLHALRGRWRLILLYRPDELLEASRLFDSVDSWASLGAFTRFAGSILTVAEAGHALWPRPADPRRGLDPVRFARLRDLRPADRAVLWRLGAGATNRQIARCLRISEGAVAHSLRRSMERLCLDTRLQLALLIARFDHDRAKGLEAAIR